MNNINLYVIPGSSYVIPGSSYVILDSSNVIPDSSYVIPGLTRNLITRKVLETRFRVKPGMT